MRLPNLDDRRWRDLTEEGRNLIPRYAPEWTDFNIHDPGITLLELFASVTEGDIYTLNRVPERHRRKFLALLGITPRSAVPSRTVAAFALDPGASPLTLPATLEVTSDQGSIPFRTLQPVTVADTEIAGLAVDDGTILADVTDAWNHQEPVLMFGRRPVPDAAFYCGFSKPLPIGEETTLYVRLAHGRTDDTERERLIRELIAAREQCSDAPHPCAVGNAPETDDQTGVLRHHSASLTWEIALASGGTVVWRELDPGAGEVVDDTRSLSLDGFVRIRVPAQMSQIQLTPKGVPLHYLRCRLSEGAFDAPPSLQTIAVNAAALEQSIPAGSMLAVAHDAAVSGTPPVPGTRAKFTFSRGADGRINVLTFLPSDAVAPAIFITSWEAPGAGSDGSLGCEMQITDTGTGEPLQTSTLRPSPVVAGTVNVYTMEENGWNSWTIRDDGDASGRTDRHVLLAGDAGVLTFGDGEAGLPVPEGVPIVATYHSTKASAGNVPAGSSLQVADSSHNRALVDLPAVLAAISWVSNPVPATGGADGESIESAEGRALEEMTRRTRAVTVGDYESLARETPGTQIARASAAPDVDGRYPCLHAPGVVTVIVIPNMPTEQPQPSAGLIAVVREYLNRRRIIGTRCEVTGPAYTTISVQAHLQCEQGVDPSRVRRDALTALATFLNPLSGGPDGTGWPFGRDVYRSEILQVLDGIPGVDNVADLGMRADEGPVVCGNICIGPRGLVVNGTHEISAA